MFRTTLLSTALLVTLAGCAQVSNVASTLNPFNWFGSSTETETETTAPQPQNAGSLIPEGERVVIVDGRSLVQNISSLTIDRGPAGAIVTAVGVTATQGYFNAQLVNTGVANGVLTLQFRAQPSVSTAVGSERSREIAAGYVISTADLAGINTVRVEAATNTRTSAR